MRFISPTVAPVACTALLLSALIIAGCGGGGGSSSGTMSKVALGKALFNSTTLSQPAGMSCATCHQASHQFVDPRQDSPTSEGVILGRFGNRQTPSVKYMKFSPKFHFDVDEDDYIGGQFWDGRAVDLQAQAHLPLTNPAEMNNPSLDAVAQRVSTGPLAAALQSVYGPAVFSDTKHTMDAVTDAIAAFESSYECNPFSSKYDDYLHGRATLTQAETRGLSLFKGKALCANCHPADLGPHGEPPLFTDFTYDNIGLPKNANNRFYLDPPSINPDGAGFLDVGLEKTTHRADDAGRFKVPTLRNIAVTGPYFHNGVATSLTDAVQFYNKRDSGIFGSPEFPDNINHDELGDLHLTDSEVSDIVAFLQTLTDK